MDDRKNARGRGEHATEGTMTGAPSAWRRDRRIPWALRLVVARPLGFLLFVDLLAQGLQALPPGRPR